MVALLNECIHCRSVDQELVGVDDCPQEQPDKNEKDVETQQKQNQEKNKPVCDIDSFRQRTSKLQILVVFSKTSVFWETA